MRQTGAACLTAVMLIALYVLVVRLQSVSAAAHYFTSFPQARLTPSQRVQGLLIPCLLLTPPGILASPAAGVWRAPDAAPVPLARAAPHGRAAAVSRYGGSCRAADGS